MAGLRQGFGYHVRMHIRDLMRAMEEIAPLAQADTLEVRFGDLQWQPDRGPALARLTPEPEDAGLQGAQLAINDNLSTGRFLGQHYQLESAILGSEDALLEALAATSDAFRFEFEDFGWGGD